MGRLSSGVRAVNARPTSFGRLGEAQTPRERSGSAWCAALGAIIQLSAWVDTAILHTAAPRPQSHSSSRELFAPLQLRQLPNGAASNSMYLQPSFAYLPFLRLVLDNSKYFRTMKSAQTSRKSAPLVGQFAVPPGLVGHAVGAGFQRLFAF